MFPLPLSDFEYYMLVDDRPSHPMVLVMKAQLAGPLQQSALQQSLDELIQSHPLLNCTVADIAGRGWCWVPSDSLTGWLEWTDGDEAFVSSHVPEARTIDLKSSAGFQAVVRASPIQASLVLYFHHACCDGIGGLQVVGELLARYGQKTAAEGEPQPVFEETRRELLLERENYDSGAATAERHKKSLRKTIGKISRLLLRKPVKLACSDGMARTAPADGAEPVPVFLYARLSQKVHQNLRAAAAAQEVSINDLLIGRILLHIRRWNSRTTSSSGRRWIRLSVPVSMRTRLHSLMPAANVVSYAFVTRRENECDDMDALVQSIHRQTSEVVFNREGIVCLKIFRILRRIPGGLKMFLGLKSCLSTAVVTNLGDTQRRYSGRFPLKDGKWVAGSVTVESMAGVAPVRPNTRAAISITEYAGELSISLRTDTTAITAADSRRFLSEFLADLGQLAADK